MDPPVQNCASVFRMRIDWRLILLPPFGTMLCPVLDGFFASVWNMLAGNDGLEHPYFSLSDDNLCLVRALRYSPRSLMNFSAESQWDQ